MGAADQGANDWLVIWYIVLCAFFHRFYSFRGFIHFSSLSHIKTVSCAYAMQDALHSEAGDQCGWNTKLGCVCMFVLSNTHECLSRFCLVVYVDVALLCFTFMTIRHQIVLTFTIIWRISQVDIVADVACKWRRGCALFGVWWVISVSCF